MKEKKQTKQTGKIYAGAWLLPELHEKLKSRALRDGRSMAKVIERTLAKELAVE